MTLERFQFLLQKIDPSLQIRQAKHGDVAGLFVGKSGKTGYITRLTKGELLVDGYRYNYPDPQDPRKMVRGPIQKRGRRTVINLLKKYRWVTTLKQECMLLHGIEYPDHEVKGLSSQKGGSNV